MYIKKFKKKYQEKWENAYLIVKNARASSAVWWALDPGQYYTAHSLNFALLRRQNLGKKFLGPPLTPNPGSTTGCNVPR